MHGADFRMFRAKVGADEGKKRFATLVIDFVGLGVGEGEEKEFEFKRQENTIRSGTTNFFRERLLVENCSSRLSDHRFDR